MILKLRTNKISVISTALFFWSISIAFLFCKCEDSVTMTLEERSAIVISVKKYFRSDCLFVLESKNPGHTRNFISEQKLLSTQQVAAVTLSAHRHLSKLQCRRNKPLLIMPALTCMTNTDRAALTTTLKGTRLSDFIWLLFLDKNASLEEFFTGINIPFDCEFLVAQLKDDHSFVLTEVYRVGPTFPLQTDRFGNWTLGSGLTWPSQGFYQRRNNLKNIALKTGTINGEYVTITKEIDNKPVEVGGVFGDIWNVLEDRLKFRSDYLKPKKQTYGAKMGNGTWNGLAGLVAENTVHIANADFIWNSMRMSVVDYITQVDQYRTYMFIKRPDSTAQLWDSYFMPLSSGLWLALMVTVGALASALWMSENLWHKYVNAVPQINLGFLQSLYFTFGAFCYTGQEEIPSHLPGRTVHLTTYLTSVVMMTSYSASLISFIMTIVYGLPFNDFQQFLDDGSYQLGMRANGSQFMHFKLSSDPVLKNVYLSHISPHEALLPITMVEGLENICTHERYASMSYESVVTTNQKRLKCILQRVPNAYIPCPLSMVIQKRSPYKGIFKITLRDMHRSGLFRIIRYRHYPDDMGEPESELTSVTLSQVTPILVVLATGCLAAMLVLTVERLSFYKRRGLGGQL